MPGLGGNIYYVAGRTGSPGASEFVWANLWNNMGNDNPVAVFYITFLVASNITAMSLQIRRTTTRGTQTSWVIPDADNHTERRRAIWPPGDVFLDVDWTADPTTQTPELVRLYGGDMRTGGGLMRYMWGNSDSESGHDQFVPIEVPDQTGLCIYSTAAAPATQGDVTFGFMAG